MPSPLSEDARQQNYRGFFNLGVIVLAVSNFRLIFDNLAKYGNKIQLRRYFNSFPGISIRFLVVVTDVNK